MEFCQSEVYARSLTLIEWTREIVCDAMAQVQRYDVAVVKEPLGLASEMYCVSWAHFEVVQSSCLCPQEGSLCVMPHCARIQSRHRQKA
jgi:hypothetical protein